MKAYDVKVLRPCRSGGIVVEGRFDREFTMRELCALLRGIGRCSEKLGVARLSHKGCDITIYRNGRVDVHGVATEDQAIEFINDIKVIVEDAFADKSFA
jgi:ArsR family metal-binding transcriptional regulator